MMLEGSKFTRKRIGYSQCGILVSNTQVVQKIISVFLIISDGCTLISTANYHFKNYLELFLPIFIVLQAILAGLKIFENPKITQNHQNIAENG